VLLNPIHVEMGNVKCGGLAHVLLLTGLQVFIIHLLHYK
jgi:hypothetical protein